MKTYVCVYRENLSWYRTTDLINSDAERNHAEIVTITRLNEYEIMVLFRKLDERKDEENDSERI